MYRFKKILFSPLGRTDNPAAIRRVADLARRNSAEVTLFGVVPAPSQLQRLLHRADYHEAVLGVERQEMTTRLTRWAEMSDGASTQSAVQVGDPALSIIGRVLAADHDLVVVTTDDDDEDRGSIRRLLRKCPCPVWVIRPTRARAPRVLAAVNPAESEAELNTTILQLAATFVELYGGELHLAHAWQLYGAPTVRSSPFLQTEASELEALLEDERAGHERALSDLVASSPVADAPWTVHLEEGPAGDVVGGLVDHHRINLLVMGTVARTGVQGLVMGNTAERILDSVGCSVIALKPPGFVSPLATGGAVSIDASVAADPEAYMAIAIEAARAAGAAGDVPVGAVAVRDGSVIATAANRREHDQDPTAHAEMIVVRAAASELGRWRLDDVTVVVTLEPCPMCAGALWAARIGGLVFGADDPRAGATGSLYNLAADPRLNHEYPQRRGPGAVESAEMLRDFFAAHRGADHTDPG